jgi:hypothetical protein
MVKQLAAAPVVLLGLAATVSAHPVLIDDGTYLIDRSPPPPPPHLEIVHDDIVAPPVEPVPPSHDKVGFRLGFGTLPVAGHSMFTGGVEVGVERRLFRQWRVFGEYEWLWLGETTPDPMDVELDGTGHRLHAGVRRRLLGKTFAKVLHFYLDGELGGGVGILSDDVTGVHVLPHGFAGVRFGYDFIGEPSNRSSRLFEAELLFRTIVVESGAGVMFGVGFQWGD